MMIFMDTDSLMPNILLNNYTTKFLIFRQNFDKELLSNNFSIVPRIFLRERHSKIRRIVGYVTDF